MTAAEIVADVTRTIAGWQKLDLRASQMWLQMTGLPRCVTWDDVRSYMIGYQMQRDLPRYLPIAA